jgi:hypothetical protein
MKSIPSLANVEIDPSAEPEFIGTATYCPEDDKIRLYVGRVPREDYLALKEEGWTSTPKQSCDFVATWTPERNRTAILFAGAIDDEDMGPEERAADRAERFAGYQEKRMDEATGHADRYDAGPAVHGFQSYARAVRSADRHDRIAGRAVDAWEKAEYWQRRTSGVIAHALHVCSPSVRMGRIKTLEAELRQMESRYTPTSDSKIMQQAYGSDETPVPHVWCGMGRGGHWVAEKHLEGIKASCASLVNHITLRLAYENQMLEAQGGRLASVEIEPGGYIGNKLIVKVNKSTVTGRVTSVALKGPAVERWTYRAENVPGTDYALYQFDTERMPMSAYTAPTDESRAELAALKAEKKAKAPTKAPCPIINPTDEDAQRLLDTWNEWGRDEREAAKKRNGWAQDFQPAEIVRMTQARYSSMSGGTYSNCETRGIRRAGIRESRSGLYNDAENTRAKTYGPPICKLRIAPSGNYHTPPLIIILTDKPQKPLPSAIWDKKVETVTA